MKRLFLIILFGVGFSLNLAIADTNLNNTNIKTMDFASMVQNSASKEILNAYKSGNLNLFDKLLKKEVEVS